jgi:hypothetical protein
LVLEKTKKPKYNMPTGITTIQADISTTIRINPPITLKVRVKSFLALE